MNYYFSSRQGFNVQLDQVSGVWESVPLIRMCSLNIPELIYQSEPERLEQILTREVALCIRVVQRGKEAGVWVCLDSWGWSSSTPLPFSARENGRKWCLGVCVCVYIRTHAYIYICACVCVKALHGSYFVVESRLGLGQSWALKDNNRSSIPVRSVVSSLQHSPQVRRKVTTNELPIRKSLSLKMGRRWRRLLLPQLLLSARLLLFCSPSHGLPRRCPRQLLCWHCGPKHTLRHGNGGVELVKSRLCCLFG